MYFCISYRCSCGNGTRCLGVPVPLWIRAVCGGLQLQEVETPPVCITLHPGFRSLRLAAGKYKTKDMNSSKSTNLIGYIRFNAFVQATNKFTETKGSSGLSPEMYCSASGAGKVAFASRYRRLRLHGTRCCLHSHLFYRHRTIRKLYIDLYHAIKLDKTHHWKEQTKISKWTNCSHTPKFCKCHQFENCDYYKVLYGRWAKRASLAHSPYKSS